jgi:hypothetical protein
MPCVLGHGAQIERTRVEVRDVDLEQRDDRLDHLIQKARGETVAHARKSLGCTVPHHRVVVLQRLDEHRYERLDFLWHVRLVLLVVHRTNRRFCTRSEDVQLVGTTPRARSQQLHREPTGELGAELGHQSVALQARGGRCVRLCNGLDGSKVLCDKAGLGGLDDLTERLEDARCLERVGRLARQRLGAGI